MTKEGITQALVQKGFSSNPTSFVFSAVTFTADGAERWVRQRGFTARKVDASVPGSITVEVATPQPDADYGTLRIAPGVIAVAAMARKEPMAEPPPDGPPTGNAAAQSPPAETRLVDLENRVARLETDVQSLLSAVFVDAGPVAEPAPEGEAMKSSDGKRARKSGLSELAVKLESIVSKANDMATTVNALTARIRAFEESLIPQRRGTGVLEEGLVAKYGDHSSSPGALFDSAFPWRRNGLRSGKQ